MKICLATISIKLRLDSTWRKFQARFLQLCVTVTDSALFFCCFSSILFIAVAFHDKHCVLTAADDVRTET